LSFHFDFLKSEAVSKLRRTWNDARGKNDRVAQKLKTLTSDVLADSETLRRD